MTPKERIDFLTQAFQTKFPNPETELEFNSPFQLLISTLMAAQATDKQVNIITRTLYQVAPTPEKMQALGEEQVAGYIKSINYYKTKAKHIVETSRILLEKFGGEVPSSLEDLQSLPGVGRKTASVVQICAFGIPAFPVDTHVFRVSNRLGIAKASDVKKTEEQLRKRIPKENWYSFHHYLILHGRYTCKAANPACESCEVTSFCSFFEKNQKKLK
ncbi:MAG: endonuclease III [Bacteroidetes bacterium]|nr:endonuclease III [Bacteroidota bacterium]